LAQVAAKTLGSAAGSSSSSRVSRPRLPACRPSRSDSRSATRASARS
jgi:hypothetical protein